MKYIFGILTVLFLFSCKSKAFLAEGKASGFMTTDKIIENHYSNKLDFSSLYIKAGAKYKDDKQSQTVTAEIKIKKDEKILVSVRFLGITMAKALITPSEVKYYEKINGTYFEGSYAALSNWLGTDLDYGKVQNLLLGEAIDDLQKGKFSSEIVDKLFKLQNISDRETERTFFFESERFLVKKQEIIQPAQGRMLAVNYPNYQKYDSGILPIGLSVEAYQRDMRTNIIIDYNTVNFNEELSFPYSVPDGYERIFIN